MKKLLLLLTFSLMLTQIVNSQGTWTRKADWGTGVPDFDGPASRNAVAFSIGGKGYIGTGYDGSYRLNDFWEFDPATGIWTQKADYAGGTTKRAVGFSMGEKGYIGTGRGPSGLTDDFWEYDPGLNTWTQKADFGGGVREDAVAFSIGEKGYIGTGYNHIDGRTKDFWEYDPVTDTWIQKDDFGGLARDIAVGFSIGEKGYIGTGDTRTFGLTDDFWEYDPGLNTWTQKADFGGGVREDAVAFSIGENGYIGTGNNSDRSRDFWEYDPSTDTWTQKADFGGTGRYEAVGFSIGGKGYIGTGDDGKLRKDFWEYDPGTNTWKQLTGFTENIAGAVGFAIGSKGYVGTGLNEDWNPIGDFREYDPATDRWTVKAHFGGSIRHRGVGFSIGDKGYLGTGFINGFAGPRSNDFWEYDPATESWTQRADYGGGGRAGAVGFSIGEKGYIGTGLDGTMNQTNDFWEYDPGLNTWTRKADFRGTIRHNAVGFSIGGKGYIGTGVDEENWSPHPDYQDFWEYDPGTDTWTRKADFAGGPRGVAVGFHVGDKGYIGTGFDENWISKKDFWEYDPIADTWAQSADFEGTERQAAVGFSIGNKGYVGTGFDGDWLLTKDFWEFTPGLVGIIADIKIFLQGPYVNPVPGGMTTTLNSSGLLPLEQPYFDTPWEYNGDEEVDGNFFAANPDIVDWILVELRTGTGAETVAGRRAAFVKNDGNVVDISGTGGVLFGDLAPGDYYIVVYHRNHLAIMSASSVPLNGEQPGIAKGVDYPLKPLIGGGTLYDFTTGQGQAYGTDPMADLGGGVFGMYAGDANKNGEVKYLGANNDRAVILNAVGPTTAANIITQVYSYADVNMDGSVKYIGEGNDRAVILNVIGATTPANVVVTQVPMQKAIFS